MKIKNLLTLVAMLLVTSAFARVDFALTEFPVSGFRNIDRVVDACAAPAASSFWCERMDETLMLIPTKGADFFFNDAGELVAVFAKQQKGQDLRGNYQIDNATNLIPMGAVMPGNALLLDGEYLAPEDATASWEQVSDTEFLGTFSFTLPGLDVTRNVIVSNITHIITTTVEAVRTEAGEEDAMLQLGYPGLGRADSPVIKIGQGESSSLNPVSTPVPGADYVSLQTSDNNRGYAIVMRPAGSGSETPLSLDEAVSAPVTDSGLTATSLSGHRIAMGHMLPAEAGAVTGLAVETYTGPNELVRFNQEGFADLPGLFSPNILGQMSLGIIWLLVFIHGFVGTWGLAIIGLTLVFRVLIWPLITTQTKSMFAMQQLQPKIQALQKKYKDDREKLTQETMKLYKEEKVNPAGGCLPILLQMPLFIILWRVFVNFEFNEGFMWLPDLGSPDPFYILPILYVGVMLAQSYFSTKGNPTMLRQQIFINLIFVFIIVNFPSGVILYFVVSMLVQVFQYWLISRNQPARPVVPAKAK